MIRQRLLSWSVSLLGIVLAIAALFATAIGLDSNASWGPSRWLMLGVGVVLAIGLPFIRLAGRLLTRLKKAINVSRLGKRLRSSEATISAWADILAARIEPLLSRAAHLVRRFFQITRLERLLRTPHRRALVAAALILGIALVFDIWFLTSGYWTRWPNTTSHFALLSDGFLHGQLHLPLQPSPQLLAAPDPYAEELRNLVPVWDISYFEGRFYLYWGPVPALLLAIPMWILGEQLGDWLVVAFATYGIAIVGSAIVFKLWKRVGDSVPWWMTTPAVALFAFGIPMTWLLSSPSVYEAAISTAQFFFLLGILLALPALLDANQQGPGLALASVSWGLAIGARITLAPAIFVLVGASVTLLLLRARRHPHVPWRSMLSLLLPLLAIGMALGWYNWARFGNVLEVGHRFQLGRTDLREEVEGIVALGNWIPNLYNYFLNAPNTLSVFPYVKPGWGAYYIWPAHYYAPEWYYTERMTGLLLVVPFVMLAVAGVYHGFRGWIDELIHRQRPAIAEIRRTRLTDTAGLFSLLAFALLAPIMSFKSATMRHMTDFVPTLVVLASLGWWLVHQSAAENTGLRRATSLAAIGLAVISVVLSLLLSMTGYAARFEQINPELFNQLTRWLTP